jgi:hypothetical protein
MRWVKLAGANRILVPKVPKEESRDAPYPKQSSSSRPQFERGPITFGEWQEK